MSECKICGGKGYVTISVVHPSNPVLDDWDTRTCECKQPVPVKRDPRDFGTWSALDISRMIVNQLFDEGGVSVERRQEINDRCDDYVAMVISTWMRDSVSGAMDAMGL